MVPLKFGILVSLCSSKRDFGFWFLVLVSGLVSCRHLTFRVQGLIWILGLRFIVVARFKFLVCFGSNVYDVVRVSVSGLGFWFRLAD